MKNQQEINQLSSSESQKQKSDRFSWPIAGILIAVTLAFSLATGYFISEKFIWNNDKDDVKIADRLDRFQALVNANPNNPEYLVELGFTYFLKEDYDKAISQYKKALGLDEGYYPASLNAAIAYEKKGDLEKAIDYALDAEKLSPRDYKAKFIKGRCYRQLKMYSDAKKAIEEAVKLSPGNVEVIAEAGHVAEDMGDKKEAEKIYREALSYDPVYQEARDGLKRVTK